jgi:hypothetical protein
MKKIIVLTFSILLILVSCDKKDSGIQSPTNFSASDGVTVGTVYIDFSLADNTQSVEVYRREKGASEYDWQLIKGADKPFFDQEGYWGGEGMPQGKVFEYRMRSCCGDNNPFTEIDEGYAYVIIPVDSIDITSTKTSNLLRWNEGNNESFLNDVKIRFDIYRAEEANGDFKKIGTADHDRSYRDDFENNTDLQGKTLYYRIDTWFYPFELSFVEGTVVASSGGSSGNSIIDYTSIDLGQVVSSATDGIIQIKEKVINNTLYVGALKDANDVQGGIPALYKQVGNSWEQQWSSMPNVKVSEINFAISGNNSFFAGRNHDSLSVYQWNGSTWSENMAADNLGKTEGPSDVAIEIFNDELYMAIRQYPDYDLQVLKYTESNWDTIGGDANGIIATGTISDVEIENIDGTLYLHYNVGDDKLYIQHLSGATWTTDLQWTQEWVGNVHLDKNGSDLYFSANTDGYSFNGGVYHVTSSTSAENLIPDDAEWFIHGAFTFAIDSDGDIIVSSMKYESTELFYPYLNLYDGTEWKTISGNFNDGIQPVGLSIIDTDIYYVYGDAATENQLGDPTSIKSKKMTK